MIANNKQFNSLNFSVGNADWADSNESKTPETSLPTIQTQNAISTLEGSKKIQDTEE